MLHAGVVASSRQRVEGSPLVAGCGFQSMRLTLSDFIKFAAASAEAKITKLRDVKRREEYTPATDFYHQIRPRLVDAARSGRVPQRDELVGVPHEKKVRHFNAIAKGAVKWFKAQGEWEWVQPERTIWEVDELQVTVNPEIGMVLNGTPHLVKLYLSKDKLQQRRVQIVTHLMSKTMRDDVEPGTQFAILDVREARLFANPEVPRDLEALLHGEAAFINAIWNRI